MKSINLDPLSDEQIAAVLKSKSATKKVEFAGEERFFYFGGLSYDIAERFDTDLKEVIETIDGGRDARKVLDAMVTLVYVMMAPFETCPDTDAGRALIKLHLGSMGQEEASAFIKSVLPESMQAKAVGNVQAAQEKPQIEVDSPRAATSESSVSASASRTTDSVALTSSPSD